MNSEYRYQASPSTGATPHGKLSTFYSPVMGNDSMPNATTRTRPPLKREHFWTKDALVSARIQNVQPLAYTDEWCLGSIQHLATSPHI